jgi:hypothetical protein
VQVGDLVKLDTVYYPLQHEIGMLIKTHPANPSDDGRGYWIVMIGGRLHPYAIGEEDMLVISEQ